MKRIVVFLLLLASVALSQPWGMGNKSFFTAEDDTARLKDKYNVLDIGARLFLAGTIRATYANIDTAYIVLDTTAVSQPDSIYGADGGLVMDTDGNLAIANWLTADSIDIDAGVLRVCTVKDSVYIGGWLNVLHAIEGDSLNVDHAVVNAQVDADSVNADHLVVNTNVSLPAGSLEAADIALTQNNILVGNVSNQAAAGTDLPTATTIGSAYVYRAGGTDVADADVVDTITASNYLLLTAVGDSIRANQADSSWNAIALGNDAENADGTINFVASDNDQGSVAITTDDKLQVSGFAGGTQFDTYTTLYQGSLGHGMTAIMETDQFAKFVANDGSDGGLTIWAANTDNDGDNRVISMRAITTDATVTSPVFEFAIGSNSGATWSGISGDTPGFLFKNGSAELLAIRSGGEVGIGAETPGAMLEINGDKSTDSLLIVRNDRIGAPYDSVFVVTKTGGFSSTGDGSISGNLSVADSMKVGGGDFIRKTFISADGLSIGFIYYNPVLTRIDTVYAVQP